jgi:hypothetical protein
MLPDMMKAQAAGGAEFTMMRNLSQIGRAKEQA